MDPAERLLQPCTSYSAVGRAGTLLQKLQLMANHQREYSKKWAIFMQVLAGLIANFASISPGMGLGFSAVALPHMESNASIPNITQDEASWIAGLGAISAPFGSLLAGPLLDRFGRKLALLTLNIPCIIGWILLSTAPETSSFIPQVYAGRILTGISAGMASVPATVYVAETSNQNLRGMLVTWNSISIALGVLIVYILGYFLKHQWRIVATISAVICLFAACLTFLLPESPVWLLSRGKTHKAENSLKKLRGTSKTKDTPPNVREELDILMINNLQQKSNKRKSGAWSSLLRPEALKPLLIMNGFFFFQQFSGTFVVIFYAVDIVNKVGVDADGYIITIFIGLIRLLVTIIVAYLSKRFGRRAPSIVSGAGMTICMGTLATYLILKETNDHLSEVMESLNWLPTAALLLYILTSTLGFLTMPWAMIGEVYPAKVRGLASGITTCLAYTFSFIIVKLYPTMLHTLGAHGIFFFYGAISLFGTIFVIMFLPETKGKSLQEIEEYFGKYKGHTTTLDNKGNENDSKSTADEHLMLQKV